MAVFSETAPSYRKSDVASATLRVSCRVAKRRSRRLGPDAREDVATDVAASLQGEDPDDRGTLIVKNNQVTQNEAVLLS